MLIAQPALESFFDKVEIDFATECWNWTASKHPRGYGLFHSGGKGWRAHKYAYERFIRKVPTGLVLDHLCRNTCCVNPWHLEAVTQRENVLRGDGIAAHAARRTHCPKGHPYDEENTRIYRRHRFCRACDRARDRTGRSRKS